MMRIVLAALFALLAGAALAATPIKITADTFTVEDALKRATFEGNVVIDREGMRLTCTRVLVEYGPEGVSDIKSFTALGSVRIQLKDQSATGDKAVFVPTTQILTMSGNVTVDGEMGTLKGPELVVDLRTNTSVFSSGGGKGRVSGTFTPQ